MSELKTTQKRGKMGPCKGQIAQDVLGFRRRWQELEAERAGSADGGSEPRAAMKKSTSWRQWFHDECAPTALPGPTTGCACVAPRTSSTVARVGGVDVADR